jgi:hypothetical protein
MKPYGDAAQYQREKRSFIASRLLWRFVYFHAALIFAATWLAGWLASWALLKLGMTSMPLRYALAFIASYLVFMLCVRVWADFMRSERGESVEPDGWDVPAADAEGCLFAVAALLLGLLAAGLFAMMGGLPLLLEVAFEVVFAGTVVRRASRKQVLGAWAGALLRNTWLHALAAWLGLITLAAVLQAKAPGAVTFSQAVRLLWL